MATNELALGREHHDHLICERCGQDPGIQPIRTSSASRRRPPGRTASSWSRHRHELFGLCKDCRVSRAIRAASPELGSHARKRPWPMTPRVPGEPPSRKKDRGGAEGAPAGVPQGEAPARVQGPRPDRGHLPRCRRSPGAGGHPREGAPQEPRRQLRHRLPDHAPAGGGRAGPRPRLWLRRGALYEVAHGRKHHDHLVCERCGLVVEFVNDQIEELQEKVASQHGFELRRHRHELFGVCERCRAASSSQPGVQAGPPGLTGARFALDSRVRPGRLMAAF